MCVCVCVSMYSYGEFQKKFLRNLVFFENFDENLEFDVFLGFWKIDDAFVGCREMHSIAFRTADP